MTRLPELETLFQNFLRYKNAAKRASLGPWLYRQTTACSFPDADQIPFRSAAYTRNRIAKENIPHDQGFEALIMRWDGQVQTSIHGHPEFSFYYVISGCFGMDLFAHSSTNGLRLTASRRLEPGKALWFLGQAGQYDNFIHRVTCLEPGHTFHVYSEDARRGVAFEDLTEYSYGFACKARGAGKAGEEIIVAQSSLETPV